MTRTSLTFCRTRVAGFALLLLLSTPWTAAGWCDLVFTDVAERAAVVAIAEVRKEGKAQPTLEVSEVFKGGQMTHPPELDEVDFSLLRLKDGDRLLMALTVEGQPIRAIPGMGNCAAVSLVPIRGGKLRGRDRSDYDGASKSMVLDEVRAELKALLGS